VFRKLTELLGFKQNIKPSTISGRQGLIVRKDVGRNIFLSRTDMGASTSLLREDVRTNTSL